MGTQIFVNSDTRFSKNDYINSSQTSKSNTIYSCCESSTNNNSTSSINSNSKLCIHKKKSNPTIVLNGHKLVNKMIQNYYNPRSVCTQDNRSVLKKLIPIYNNLIKIIYSFTEKVIKLKNNLNPTKSSKIFTIIYESYKSFVFNYYRSFSSTLNIKYKGNDILEYTLNNVESSNTNSVNYAACNNFYETNKSMDKSTLFYSVPGLTLLFKYDTLSFRIIAKKSIFGSKCKINKYDFLLIPGSCMDCNKINKGSFLKVLESISDFRNSKSNNLLEFINFLQHEKKKIKCIL